MQHNDVMELGEQFNFEAMTDGEKCYVRIDNAPIARGDSVTIEMNGKQAIELRNKLNAMISEHWYIGSRNVNA